jgi:uncharacterized protein YjbJ (UPF0337 family)
MGLDDKVEHPELADEGRGEQTEAQVKQAGEHVKDAAREVRDTFTSE